MMILSSLKRSCYTITTTISRLLVFSISSDALVAFADFLLCVFLCDGTVALCNCLKHAKTFGVWCHVASAPGGAWRWWRGGQTWHATHTLWWPCHTGNGLSGWNILEEFSFRQTLFMRFHGLIIEDIYWLSAWHTCAHACKIQQTRTNIHKHGETQRRGEKRCQTAVKQQVTHGHTLEKHARIPRLYIKNTVCIYIHQRMWSWEKQRTKQGVWTDGCVCVCVCAGYHSCPWSEVQTASCRYQRRSVRLVCGWPVSCGFGGGAVWAGPRGSSSWHPDLRDPTPRADPEPCLIKTTQKGGFPHHSALIVTSKRLLLTASVPAWHQMLSCLFRPKPTHCCWFNRTKPG